MQTKLNWRDSRSLDIFEMEREAHRRRNHRITYDCQEAHSVAGNRVICARGKILSDLSLDGSIYLLFVIRGRTSYRCKDCPWFRKP